MKQFGGIKTRDKAYEGKGYISRKPAVASHVESYPPSTTGQFEGEQAARLEVLGQRISADEVLLRSRGINPCRASTAGKFDKLVE